MSSLSSSGSAPRRRPQDGPATVFEADPIVQLVLDQNQDQFGLIVVTGWPPNPEPSLQGPYRTFLERVRDCFDPVDHREGNVYLYEFQYLHVTVATLHGVNRYTTDPDERRILQQFWTDLVTRASRRPEWPQSPLQLCVEHAQIGTRAGILLWRETTGGLDRMRECVRVEAAAAAAAEHHAEMMTRTLSIPPIVHSTFLRFARVPVTDGTRVQERFRKILPLLPDLFVGHRMCPHAKLVCEWTPHMHFPDDDKHVLATFLFQK